MDAFERLRNAVQGGLIPAFAAASNDILAPNLVIGYDLLREKFAVFSPPKHGPLTFRKARVMEIFPLGTRTPQRLSLGEVVDWIPTCGTENNKAAWVQFNQQFGAKRFKKREFENVWRLLKQRKRGRISKSS